MTIPYKERVADFLDEISENAAKAGGGEYHNPQCVTGLVGDNSDIGWFC